MVIAVLTFPNKGGPFGGRILVSDRRTKSLYYCVPVFWSQGLGSGKYGNRCEIQFCIVSDHVSSYVIHRRRKPIYRLRLKSVQAFYVIRNVLFSKMKRRIDHLLNGSIVTPEYFLLLIGRHNMLAHESGLFHRQVSEAMLHLEEVQHSHPFLSILWTIVDRQRLARCPTSISDNSTLFWYSDYIVYISPDHFLGNDREPFQVIYRGEGL